MLATSAVLRSSLSAYFFSTGDALQMAGVSVLGASFERRTRPPLMLSRRIFSFRGLFSANYFFPARFFWETAAKKLGDFRIILCLVSCSMYNAS